MHRPACLLAAVLFFTLTHTTRADEPAEAPRWSVGTSAWLLANAFPKPPQFYYLELARFLDQHTAIVVEPLTWKYDAPVGIPYGSSLGDASERYPGYVRSIGLGVGARYDFYRGLNVSLRGYHFLQLYKEEGQPQKHGYQLFLQTRAGYRWPSGKQGFWIEPALAANWWPIESGRPASFRAKDDRWPSYFVPEFWLNGGYQW